MNPFHPYGNPMYCYKLSNFINVTNLKTAHDYIQMTALFTTLNNYSGLQIKQSTTETFSFSVWLTVKATMM